VNQLESGRLYDRDLDHVVAAAAKLYESLERRLRNRALIPHPGSNPRMPASRRVYPRTPISCQRLRAQPCRKPEHPIALLNACG